jgi:hypothetical protein
MLSERFQIGDSNHKGGSTEMIWFSYGWNLLWMAAMMLLFWGALIAVIVFSIRLVNRPASKGDGVA